MSDVVLIAIGKTAVVALAIIVVSVVIALIVRLVFKLQDHDRAITKLRADISIMGSELGNVHETLVSMLDTLERIKSCRERTSA